MTVVDHSLMKTTILLLVSDPVIRSILKETLEREGYTVLASGDLGQAVDRLQECVMRQNRESFNSRRGLLGL